MTPGRRPAAGPAAIRPSVRPPAQASNQLAVEVPVGLGDERILGREVVVDQSDGHFGLGTDAADGQTLVPEPLQALDGRLNERPPPRVRELALEARLCSFFLGRFNQAAVLSRPRLKSARISRAALCPGAPVTPPPGWVPAPHIYRPGRGPR